MRRIRVVSRALSRPFGGGMTLILLFRGGPIQGDHPPKSPFLRGTQGLPPSGHLQSKTSGTFTMVEGERIHAAEERPFLRPPGGFAAGPSRSESVV